MINEEEFDIEKIVEYLKNDIKLLENKEKYKEMTNEQLRGCMINNTGILLFLFEELLSRRNESSKEDIINKKTPNIYL